MLTNNPTDITPELDGGVIKTIITSGEGTSKPLNGSTVSVHYTGTLEDGSVFDSSRERGPFEFELGKSSVIKAWEIGVVTMTKGEVSKFKCAPEYAYGVNGSPPKIPPNATLNFEIEMLNWRAEDLSPEKDGSILRTILEQGEGYSSPDECSTVEIHLTGEYNESVFEDRNVTFILGEGSEEGICTGVEKALEKFKLGEKSKLEIKSKYAYGSKGKPDSQIPENANVIFIVKLKKFEKLKSFWTLQPAEKIVQAESFKERGTKYFKESKFPLAVKNYKKMDDYIGNGVGFSGDESEKQCELKKAMHLNVALCHLKMNENTTARNDLSYVLEMEPENIKALFRRGQSFLNSGEPDNAKLDFEKVLEIEPTNSAAKKNLQECKSLIAKQRSQEKKIYANMFEKFAKHDKENQNWVHGWWDGKQAKIDLFVPTETEEEEMTKRKKEREATLKEFERKKKLMEAEKNRSKNLNEKSEIEQSKNFSVNETLENIEENNENREEEERKKQPDVMKTLGEWGQDEREREPTEFEKENPNIFMLDGTGDFKNM